MNIKDRFPDEAAVRAGIQTGKYDLLQSVKAAVAPLEPEYRRQLRRRRISYGFFVISLIGYLMLDFGFELAISQTAVIAIAIGLLLIGIVGGIKYFSGTTAVINSFNAKLNKVLFPAIVKMFGVRAVVVQADNLEGAVHKTWPRKFFSTIAAQTSQYHEQVKQLLEHSELVTEPHNTVVVDDMMSLTIHDTPLFLSELDVRHVTGSGKNRREKKIFKGYLASYDLPRSLEGKTFVTTEKDKSGFANQSFFKKVFATEEVGVTELEWNDFEDLLHVVSSNPTEARYILTPDFMQDLYQWWQDKKVPIRISFLHNRMYVLFPDKRIRFGSTLDAITEAHLVPYAESVALPLLHVLHLVEDVQDRFRV